MLLSKLKRYDKKIEEKRKLLDFGAGQQSLCLHWSVSMMNWV